MGTGQGGRNPTAPSRNPAATPGPSVCRRLAATVRATLSLPPGSCPQRGIAHLRTDCPRLVLCTLGAPERGAPDGIPNDLRSDHEANSRSTCVSGTCRPAWLRGWTSYCCWTRVAATGASGQLHGPASTISRWKRRFNRDGIVSPGSVHPGQQPIKLTPALGARVLTRTRQAPPDGSPHWSLRKMAALMRVNLNIIFLRIVAIDVTSHARWRLLAAPGRASVGGSLAAGSSLLARGESDYGTSRPPGTHEPQSPASHDREPRVTTRLQSAPAACSCFERGESRPFVHHRSGNRRGQSRLCSCRT